MSAIWDFGDGTPVVDRGNRMVASHVYRKAGDYRVSVTILDEDGTVFEQASKKINVKNMEPRLSYTAVAVNADKPAQLTFSAATHGQDIAMYDKPLNILWDFGDGNQRAGKDLFKVTHNYAKTGTYQTTATVTTAFGDTKTRKKKIKVLAQDDDTSSNDLLDDGDSLIPPDVIANKVNLQVMGDVNAKVNATALRIAASTFMAPNKDGSCKFWMNFWDDQTLMQGSLQVNLGRLPKLTTGQETSNFDFSGKQRFDLGFFASGQQEQYVFGKRQLMAGPVSELGNTVHDFHTKAGFRMKSGKLKLSLKNGDYIVGDGCHQ